MFADKNGCWNAIFSGVDGPEGTFAQKAQQLAQKNNIRYSKFWQNSVATVHNFFSDYFLDLIFLLLFLFIAKDINSVNTVYRFDNFTLRKDEKKAFVASLTYGEIT